MRLRRMMHRHLSLHLVFTLYHPLYICPTHNQPFYTHIQLHKNHRTTCLYPQVHNCCQISTSFKIMRRIATGECQKTSEYRLKGRLSVMVLKVYNNYLCFLWLIRKTMCLCLFKCIFSYKCVHPLLRSLFYLYFGLFVISRP